MFKTRRRKGGAARAAFRGLKSALPTSFRRAWRGFAVREGVSMPGEKGALNAPVLVRWVIRFS